MVLGAPVGVVFDAQRTARPQHRTRVASMSRDPAARLGRLPRRTSSKPSGTHRPLRSGMLGVTPSSAIRLVQDAVIRNLEVIGEACSNIEKHCPAFAAGHPPLPLASAYQMQCAGARLFQGGLRHRRQTIGTTCPACVRTKSAQRRRPRVAV